mmetsp:Transcript_918/g.1636  ORF Transcript_918/g.1636 Transcript_918/m.1636 type:complete len:255 (-) Transcript_918:321-1085(-)
MIHHCTVQYCTPVCKGSHLVWLKRLCESFHLRFAQDSLQVNLLKNRESWNGSTTLVLVQGGQHTRALGPRRGEDAAGDGGGERGGELLLVHLLPVDVLVLMLAQLVVAQRRLQEAPLCVQDAGVADFVLQCEDLFRITSLFLVFRQEERRALDVRLCLHGVVVLQVQPGNLYALSQLVFRVQDTIAGLQINPTEDLRSHAPVLPTFVHICERLSYGGDLLFEGNHAGLYLLERVFSHDFVHARLQLSYVRGKLS